MKTKEVIQTKNYVAKMTVKKNPRDGEYYDFLFITKKTNQRIHFGVRAVYDKVNGVMGQEIVYFEDRGIAKEIKMEIINAGGDKVLNSFSKEFNGGVVPKATLQYFAHFDYKKKMLFLDSFRIVEAII